MNGTGGGLVRDPVIEPVQKGKRNALLGLFHDFYQKFVHPACLD